MTITARAQQSRLTDRSISDRIDSAILWITIGTLFIVPLIFSYYGFVSNFTELKLVTLHLGAGLIAILWLWQIVYNRLNSKSDRDSGGAWDLRGWLGSNPARWALAIASTWLLFQAISTLLSPIPRISLFGADDARSGYNFYDAASMTVLFLSVAVRFRSARNLKLLVYTLASTGTIAAAYGLAQHFGWDPIGENANLNRIVASFGNPLNFGGYLVMTIPATLAASYFDRDKKYVWAFVAFVALAIQLAALWYSGGRGPYVSAGTALVSFFVIGLIVGNPRSLIRPAVVLVEAAILTAAIIVIPPEQTGIGADRILSIGSQLGGSDSISTDIEGGLEGRFKIWNTALTEATHWKVPEPESCVKSILRPVFGLGPDMFIYSFPLVGEPQSGFALVDHPHNYELQILMEQGFAGFIVFVALGVVLLMVVITTVKRRRSSGGEFDISSVLMLALIPPVIAKLVEIQIGVPRVADLAMMFALFGAVVALHHLSNNGKIPANAGGDNTDDPVQGSSNSALAFKPSKGIVLGSSILAALVISVAVISAFVSWDIRRTTASRARVVAVSDESEMVRALGWVDTQARTPERSSYTNPLFIEYFNAAINQRKLGNEEGSSALMMESRNLLLDFEKYDPFKRDAQINLFRTAVTLTTWGESDYEQETVDRAIKIVDLYPTYPSVAATLASDMASIGQYDLAIEFADKAIATEETTQPWASAWFAKGQALHELGRTDEAIEILSVATVKDPESAGSILSHRLLAEIYEARGDTERAELHKEQGEG